MDCYLLVKGGVVQLVGNVMPVFTRHEAAQRYAANKPGVSVAHVGSIEGETLQGHLDANHANGYRAALITSYHGGKLSGRELVRR